jgi:hypothetical protein
MWLNNNISEYQITIFTKCMSIFIVSYISNKKEKVHWFLKIKQIENKNLQIFFVLDKVAKLYFFCLKDN